MTQYNLHDIHLSLTKASALILHDIHLSLTKASALITCTVSSNFLLDKGRVAENLQKECLCYFINDGVSCNYKDYSCIFCSWFSIC